MPTFRPGPSPADNAGTRAGPRAIRPCRRRLRTNPAVAFGSSRAASRSGIAQSITDSRFGHEQLRTRRFGFDLLAQRCHVDPQIMCLAGMTGTPDLVQDLTMR